MFLQNGALMTSQDNVGIPNPWAYRFDYCLPLSKISESSIHYLMRNRALKCSHFEGLCKCAFSFLERVGVSGGSLFKKMIGNCFTFHMVPETESFILF